MAKLVMYQDSNFAGASREITQDAGNLNSIGFNDRVSSIKVMGSVWVGYEHVDYGGRHNILEEGDYSDWNAWKGSNDQISSFKKLDPVIGDSPQITLYQHTNYDGRAVTFTYDIDNLKYYSFNDEASSLRVKSGIWILYQHNNYEGRQYVVTEGSYAIPESWGGANDQISSLRPAREPHFPTEVLSMEFDIAAGLLHTTPVTLVNLSQRNDSSVVQAASWSTTRILSTTKTYEWLWENSTAISLDTTFSTGVPFFAEGEIKIGVINTFSIGENRGSENTQSDVWRFSLRATVKAKTELRVQVNITHGLIDVPFTAVLMKGNRRWKEKGMYNGAQSYSLGVDYKEIPL